MPDLKHIAQAARRVPALNVILESRAWQEARFRFAQLFGGRGDRPFTQFMRAPTQIEVFATQIMPELKVEGQLRILLIGCSRGSEPYSIASTLLRHHPDLDFRIDAYDIDPDLIAQAKSATYSHEEALDNTLLPPWFQDATFETRGDRYVVRPHIASRVLFDIADVFDERLVDRVGTAPVLFAQNMLINFRRRDAARGFHNLIPLARPNGVLFLDGIDLDLRARLAKEYGLRPIALELERIHEDARAVRAALYPWTYMGLEPLRKRGDWVRRYATIYAAAPRTG